MCQGQATLQNRDTYGHLFPGQEADWFANGTIRTSDESEWPEIQDQLIDAMIRLEKALSPSIAEVKDALSSSQKLAMTAALQT